MFSGIFAAAINNSAAVFPEEEDALKPLTQKVQTHTGCCPTQIARCDSKDTVTPVNSHSNEKSPDKTFFFLTCWELSLKLGAG